MDDPISVPSFPCFWCQVSVFRCQFVSFSLLKPDTRNLIFVKCDVVEIGIGR
jgi:hypothetical protein